MLKQLHIEYLIIESYSRLIFKNSTFDWMQLNLNKIQSDLLRLLPSGYYTVKFYFLGDIGIFSSLNRSDCSQYFLYRVWTVKNFQVQVMLKSFSSTLRKVDLLIEMVQNGKYLNNWKVQTFVISEFLERKIFRDSSLFVYSLSLFIVCYTFPTLNC